MSTSLKTAFPDLDYHFRVIGTEGKCQGDFAIERDS